MPVLLDLFLAFAKIGLFTFGGGYAMLSVIEDTCVERKKWITYDEMMNLTVVAESTPGPIAINCATFIGYRQRGWLGAIVATVGMVLPSFVILYLISLFLDDFLSVAVIAHAFLGIKAAVGLLILDAGLRMCKNLPRKGLAPVIFLLCFGAVLTINFCGWNFSTVYLMLAAALAGIVATGVLSRREKRGGKEE